MPSTLFNPRAHFGALLELGWPERVARLRLWGYQGGVYAAIHLLDEPAWLALMFC